jgi:hypothetical protein
MLALDLPPRSLAAIVAFHAIVNVPQERLAPAFSEMFRTLAGACDGQDAVSHCGVKFPEEGGSTDLEQIVSETTFLNTVSEPAIGHRWCRRRLPGSLRATRPGSCSAFARGSLFDIIWLRARKTESPNSCVRYP